MHGNENSAKGILEVDSLLVSYEKGGDNNTVLKGLSFNLAKDEVLCILGESGSGKSTAVKAITGLLPPSAKVSGTLVLNRQRHVDFSSDTIDWSKIRGREIGFIFQDAQQALNPMKKIKDHFKESILYHHIGLKKDVVAISKYYLKFLNFKNFDQILNAYPFQLSGGMCQRVCIALALCLKPNILIADEATSALDIFSQIEVIKLLKKTQRELGLSILFITHDISVAGLIADRVIVLRNGETEDKGALKEFFKHPKSDYTKQLFNFRKQIPELLNYRHKNETNPKLLLEIRQLNKSFKNKDKSVLRDISISISENEIVGILGESGCGKSTLARCIVGLEEADNGQILYRGEKIYTFKGKKRREVYKNMQLIFQDGRACLNPRRNVLQLVKEPSRYLKLYKREDVDEAAKYYLHEVGISERLYIRRPPELSTGQCQRVAIARALTVRPELLICDEVVSALDAANRTQILELLLAIHKKRGISILMISHDITVIRKVCNRIAVMNGGCFCDILHASNMKESCCHQYTRKLLRFEEKIKTSSYSYM